jgi:hypothetical protein
MSFYLTYNEADIIHCDCLASRGVSATRTNMNEGPPSINKSWNSFSRFPTFSFIQSLTTAYKTAWYTKELLVFRLQFDQVVHLYYKNFDYFLISVIILAPQMETQPVYGRTSWLGTRRQPLTGRHSLKNEKLSCFISPCSWLIHYVRNESASH